MISVLILTYNEERNLPACLEAVKWSDDIVVLDSFSSDRTVEIARNAGARVVQRRFDSELNQRQFALRDIQYKHPWVYNPDADEITLPELRDEMLSRVAEPGSGEVAYRVRFKTIFMGKWLRFSSLYPTWVMRLFRPERITFEREINLVYKVDGREGRLSSHFLHYSFNNGLDAWFDKHNRYSRAEALETAKSLSGRFDKGGDLFAFGDAPRRRRALKELSFRLPFRPTLRFLYMYVLRGGFLDGTPGFLYCRLLAAYEFMIVVKLREMQPQRAAKSP